MSTKDITVRDVGPITELRIPFDDAGGVYQLVGPNGAGKTTAINAALALQGAVPKDLGLSARDGTFSGSIDGLGIHMVIGGRKLERGGELQVLALEGGFDPSIIVDPGYDDPLANDARRISALCRVANIGPNIDLFAPLLGENGAKKIRELVAEETISKLTLPEQAASVKRDFERVAREYEKQGDQLSGAISALTAQYDGVDTKVETDKEKLQSALVQAAGAVQALDDRKSRAEKSGAEAAAAKAKLSESREATGPSVDECEKIESAAKDEVEVAALNVAKEVDAVAAAQARLSEARSAQVAAKLALLNAEAATKRARGLVAQREAAERALAALKEVEAPSESEFIAARTKLIEAEAAQSRGVLARNALAKKAEAESKMAQLGAIQTAAMHLRDAAAACENVVARSVSDALKSTGISIAGGRLLIEHPRRGKIPFDELSVGESFRFAVPACARALRRRGGQDVAAVLPICQEGWEALDPTNRAEVHAIALAEHCVILTAKADDGALRVERYDPATSSAP